jgi:hypothetical protein
MIMRRPLLGSLSALLLLTLAAPARGDAPDAAATATARALAQEGLEHFDAGRWEAALAKFDRADAIVHAPTIRLLAGRSLEKLGRLVEANEKYLAAARSTIDAGASDAFKEAVADADKAQRALAPRIPRLVVALDGADAADVAATLDGKPLPGAMIGAARPTDPGHHELVAKRGDATVKRAVDLAEGESISVTLVFPPSTGTVASAANPGGAQWIAGWATLAAGGALLGASGVTLGLGLSAKSSLVSAWKCTSALVCPPAASEAVTRYQALRTANTATFAIGAAALVAGVVVLATAPRAPRAEKAARWHPWIGPGRVGIEGAF